MYLPIGRVQLSSSQHSHLRYRHASDSKVASVHRKILCIRSRVSVSLGVTFSSCLAAVILEILLSAILQTPVLTAPSSKSSYIRAISARPGTFKYSHRTIHIQSTLPSRTMSSFSNTDTGNKPADPYKAANKDDPSISEKIEALINFYSERKFGMMTTRDSASGRLVSRCMAYAAKASLCPIPFVCTTWP
jgi:hypothetical protein